MNEMQLIFSIIAAFFGGAINSVAGGGTFLLFPVLILGGVSPVSANILCSIGLWPASISSAFAYKNEFGRLNKAFVILLITSLIGSAIGTLILLNTSEQTFETLIPWLLLGATLIFTFGKKITFGRLQTPHWVLWIIQFLIALYGGYFGAGIGILMLAMLQLMGMRDIHAMNAHKTLLASAINLVAVLLFIQSGKIMWDIAVWLIVASLLGGFVGAKTALKVAPQKIRLLVSVIGFSMTAYFFIHGT